MLSPGSMQEAIAMGEYDRWQGRYAAPEYIFGEGPNAFLAAQRHLQICPARDWLRPLRSIARPARCLDLNEEGPGAGATMRYR